MKSTIKEGEVTKNLESLKNKEASENGIKDFFNLRDRSKRGSSGLITDASETLSKEVDKKQSLYEKSLEVNSIPKHVRPMSNGIFLTAKRNKITQDGLYLPTAFDSDGELDLEVDFSKKQIVLAKGIHATQVEVGMEVVLKFDNFKERLADSMAQRVNKEYKYNIPVEEIDGVEYIYVSERDISYISNTNE